MTTETEPRSVDNVVFGLITGLVAFAQRELAIRDLRRRSKKAKKIILGLKKSHFVSHEVLDKEFRW
jgi:hypothetical protein